MWWVLGMEIIVFITFLQLLTNKMYFTCHFPLPTDRYFSSNITIDDFPYIYYSYRFPPGKVYASNMSNAERCFEKMKLIVLCSFIRHLFESFNNQTHHHHPISVHYWTQPPPILGILRLNSQITEILLLVVYSYVQYSALNYLML